MVGDRQLLVFVECFEVDFWIWWVLVLFLFGFVD